MGICHTQQHMHNNQHLTSCPRSKYSMSHRHEKETSSFSSILSQIRIKPKYSVVKIKVNNRRSSIKNTFPILLLPAFPISHLTKDNFQPRKLQYQLQILVHSIKTHTHITVSFFKSNQQYKGEVKGTRQARRLCTAKFILLRICRRGVRALFSNEAIISPVTYTLGKMLSIYFPEEVQSTAAASQENENKLWHSSVMKFLLPNSTCIMFTSL